MSEIQIEKGVPLPHRAKRRAFAFDAMDIGDSFVTEVNARNELYAQARRANIKITTRLENGMVRVWRIA